MSSASAGIARHASTRALVGFGLVAATVAWIALCTSLTVLSAERLADSANELLEADELRAFLSDELEDQVGAVAPGVAGTPQLDEATDLALDDPAFVEAFRGSLIALHDQVFSGDDATLVLDSGAVSAATQRSLAQVDPGLAAQIPPDFRVDVSLADVDQIPDLSWVTTLVDAVAIVGALIAIVLLALALASAPDRPAVLARVGRWAVVLAGAQLIAAFVLPLLLLAVASGGWPEVGIRAWRAFASGLVLPSIVLALVGVGLLAGARWLRRPQAPEPRPGVAPPTSDRIREPVAPGAPSTPAARGPVRDRVRSWVWPER